jgi:hypothetical protein
MDINDLWERPSPSPCPDDAPWLIVVRMARAGWESIVEGAERFGPEPVRIAAHVRVTVLARWGMSPEWQERVEPLIRQLIEDCLADLHTRKGEADHDSS